MAKPTAAQVLYIIKNVDWSGHFEMTELDAAWLADTIASSLSGDGMTCEACGLRREVVVETNLGTMCEQCIAEATADAASLRECLEDE